MMNQRHGTHRTHTNDDLLTISAYDEATMQTNMVVTPMPRDHTNPYTIIVTAPELAKNNGFYQPDPSVEQTLLLKDESMQFIYRQQHSSSSLKQIDVDFLRRIQQSSIDINEQSRWIDLRGISPSTSSAAINCKITQERKKIQQQKMRIQKEKQELQKKRIQIEALLKEYYRIREDSTKVDTISMNSSASYRIEKTRKLSAKQSMLLESMGISIIKNQNEYKMGLRAIQADFIKRLRDNRKYKKLQQCTQQIVYSSNFIHIGQAFMMIRKEADRVVRQSITKRNIVIKFNKKEQLDKSALCYNEVRIRPFTDRLCQTEASRVEKLTERDVNITDVDFDRQTVVQRKTMRGNPCVAEIDMIIKNQLMRAKQQKMLRELSKDDIETVVFNSMISSGSTTCKASQNLKKCSEIKVMMRTPPQNMKQSRHSTATVSKKIQLKRV